MSGDLPVEKLCSRPATLIGRPIVRDEVRDGYHRRIKSIPNTFMTVKYRPRTPLLVHKEARVDESEDVAIVIQGPIQEDGDFTVNTVDWYRTLFPQAPIIVSTWLGSSSRAISALRNRGCEVLLSRFPEFSGPYNVNLQILSTRAGLDHASSLGSPFALKTRSDQRFHNKASLTFLKSILETFPLHENHNHAQRKRIVTSSMGSFLYRLYGLTDMFQFGAVEDLLTFWSVPLDLRSGDTMEPHQTKSLRELALRRKGEIFLMESFLKRTGFETEWTLAAYWRAVGERFAVVDSESLDLFWPKYSNLEQRWADYSNAPSHAQVDMATWLSLYVGSQMADEYILDLPLSEVGPVLTTENRPERWEAQR